jgi:hypothetical protein
MIIKENLIIDGVELIKTYSDTYMLKQVQTGVIYQEAIDVPGKYTYKEVKTMPIENSIIGK